MSGNGKRKGYEFCSVYLHLRIEIYASHSLSFTHKTQTILNEVQIPQTIKGGKIEMGCKFIVDYQSARQLLPNFNGYKHYLLSVLVPKLVHLFYLDILCLSFWFFFTLHY